MVKSAVQVCVRTRPTANFAHNNIKIDGDHIDVHIAKDQTQHINNQLEDWRFSFDHILDNASQQSVYELCAEDIVTSTMDGYNGTILAYGQTGAGKTFTMVGGHHSYEYRGIIPRAINQIFRHVAATPEKEYRIQVSYLEIYNECFYDLLDATGGNIGDVAVQEDERGMTVVKGLTLSTIHTEEDALNLLFTGDTNRAIGSHLMNKASSRSHCVFTVHVDCRSRVESSEKIMVSKLNLVDLAGSERVKKTGSTGNTLNEAKFINKSLTFLEQVVMALGNRQREHIPFRQSKLTNVLRDSLGGNCKTRLIANVWAERAQLEETISTLKFATRMMRVSTEATLNVRLDPDMLVKKYQQQIRDLKHELAMHDTLVNRCAVQYDEFTPEQRDEMQSLVRKYIAGDVNEIEIVNIRQIHELFQQFRMYCQRLTATASASVVTVQQPQLSSAHLMSNDSSSGGGSARITTKSTEAVTTKDLVGDIDENVGFSVGEAPASSAPPLSPPPQQQQQQQAAAASTTPVARVALITSASNGSIASRAREPLPSEEDVYPVYLSESDGAALKRAFVDNRTSLKAKKREFKAISQKVNEVKAIIDELTTSLEHLRRLHDDDDAYDDPNLDGDIVDEEEYALINQLQSEKAQYQRLFNDRRDMHTEVVYLKGLVDSSKTALAKGFETWYNDKYGYLMKRNNGDDDDENDGNQELDDAERFDKLEMARVMKQNPDSIHFYNAKKQLRKKQGRKQQHASGSGGGVSRHVQKTENHRPAFV